MVDLCLWFASFYTLRRFLRLSYRSPIFIVVGAKATKMTRMSWRFDGHIRQRPEASHLIVLRLLASMAARQHALSLASAEAVRGLRFSLVARDYGRGVRAYVDNLAALYKLDYDFPLHVRSASPRSDSLHI